MKMRKLLLVLIGFISMTTCVYGQVDYNDPKVRNPQNDPDVERGWQKAQEQNRQEKAADKQQQKDALPHTERQWNNQQRGDDNYTIKKTHDQPPGH